MKKVNRYPKEFVLKTARYCKTLAEFNKLHPRLYRSAYRRGYLIEIKKFLHVGPKIKWTLQIITELSLNYESVKEFRINELNAYHAAYRKGYLEHIKSTMTPRFVHTFDTVKTLALLCKTRTEFAKKHGAAYNAALRNGWLKEVTRHMTLIGDKKHKCVYVILLGNSYAYIGITFNIESRLRGHLSNDKTIKKAMRQLNLGIRIFRLTTYLYYETARRLEEHYINIFRKQGYKILNSAPTGAIGGSERKWTSKKIISTAKKCKSAKEFRSRYPGAYSAAKKLVLIKDLKSILIYERKKWTNEMLENEALKYSSHIEFQKNAASAVNAARRRGIYSEITSHFVRQVNLPWNLQTAIEEAKNNKTLSDFRTKSKGAYLFIVREKKTNLLSEIFKPKLVHWTVKRVYEVAKECNSRNDFRIKFGSAYNHARRNNYFDSLILTQGWK